MTTPSIGVRVAQMCRPSERLSPPPVAFLCTDALRPTELLLETKATAHPTVHALADPFCFDLAHTWPPLLYDQRVFVPLEESS
jgi:hypothetical protein